jgi:hypothetical protein
VRVRSSRFEPGCLLLPRGKGVLGEDLGVAQRVREVDDDVERPNPEAKAKVVVAMLGSSRKSSAPAPGQNTR